VKFICAIVFLVAASDFAGAAQQSILQKIPLPRPRPFPAIVAAKPAPTLPTKPAPKSVELSACRLQLAPLAVASSLAPIEGPGECGGPDLVKLEAILLADQSQVAIKPPATLRCTMAQAVVSWVREDVAAAAQRLGARLAGIENYDSYDCRGRNNIPGAKLSEHGKANALDIRTFKLADGRVVSPTDMRVTKDFREGLRRSACARFNTVLGPGSDGYHEDHVHVDLQERGPRRFTMCQWDVHDAEPADKAAAARNVPLPPPRPSMLRPSIMPASAATRPASVPSAASRSRL
jgi:hypothetical protein